jgi:hypothetical protein
MEESERQVACVLPAYTYILGSPKRESVLTVKFRQPRHESYILDSPNRKPVLTVKLHQPRHEFTFGVGITFIPYPLVLTP